MLLEGDSGSAGGGEGKSVSLFSGGVSSPFMSWSSPSAPWGWQRGGVVGFLIICVSRDFSLR
jgi:hypothetical protein